MKIYIVRHGESETNAKHLYTGWLDVSLTEKGERDALFAKKILSSVTPDKVMSSDLARAIRTAAIALPSYTPSLTPLLREFDVGTLAGKPISDVTEEQIKSIRKNGFSEYGGESRSSFEERIRAFMKLCEESGAECIVAFSHNGFMRSIMDEIIGTRLPREKIRFSNCAVLVLEYTKGNWKIHSLINP